jgi:23S rRNA (adenine2503-C2)-methyltransferase
MATLRSRPATIALQAVTPAQLHAALPEVPLAEARKVIAMVHRDEPVHAGSSVRRISAERVRERGWVPELVVASESASQVDPFVRYAFDTADGRRIETVRIPLEAAGRFSVCVSSQVGCALACEFCATGRLGLLRNLEVWEIVEQVRQVRRRLPGGRVHSVVFQGMGEPMANLDSVIAAIAVLSEPCAQGIDARNITVSTAGLPGGIRKLADRAPKVRLAISVGSFLPEVRARIMPVTRAHSLAEVIAAGAEHVARTGLAPMWAVTLLAGVNDSDDDAQALAVAARQFATETGKRPRISIIPFNAIEGAPFRRSDDVREAAFRAVLAGAGLANHKRYSGGQDVAAACGQLAGR